tara:strand:+ start:92 stop:202 length:111 start_codon:yes stop_codon:yes gene_type:complete
MIKPFYKLKILLIIINKKNKTQKRIPKNIPLKKLPL